MLHIFKNEKKISIIFFIILTIDILVKLNLSPFPYRYISKPLVIILLSLYYYFNTNERRHKKKLWITLALFCFLVGDMLILKHTNIIFLSISMFFFAMGKAFLSLRLSHRSDFNIMRLIPFSMILFTYTFFIVSFLYNSLKGFFIPALISFFVSLLLIEFAFLRKDVVNKVSYLYVLLGTVFYVLCESMIAIKTFKMDLPMQDVLIMAVYGIAMYLIVFGIVRENKKGGGISFF
ncbi:lysoplasmalogenase family protein [Flavivirga aquimarina]|uniref:Lysoplasmalogenase family protein n=1 Tax=Flavivirga aquimarina TaxID=2027862 RepID=A0ABT8W9B4_9FLAO|nr:lysoplasmalogenase family protein [Flavivirga aquimarina]MDO5969725.1 lysoplasmalogenase family protein [Flavivirga aquimarina]